MLLCPCLFATHWNAVSFSHYIASLLAKWPGTVVIRTQASKFCMIKKWWNHVVPARTAAWPYLLHYMTWSSIAKKTFFAQSNKINAPPLDHLYQQLITSPSFCSSTNAQAKAAMKELEAQRHLLPQPCLCLYWWGQKCWYDTIVSAPCQNGYSFSVWERTPHFRVSLPLLATFVAPVI